MSKHLQCFRRRFSSQYYPRHQEAVLPLLLSADLSLAHPFILFLIEIQYNVHTTASIEDGTAKRLAAIIQHPALCLLLIEQASYVDRLITYTKDLEPGGYGGAGERGMLFSSAYFGLLGSLWLGSL